MLQDQCYFLNVKPPIESTRAGASFCESMSLQIPASFNSANLIDVLDIVVKDFVLPVTMTDCHALSSDHLPVQVNAQCRSSFQVPPALPNLKRVDWAHFQEHIAAELPGETRVEIMEDIDASIETLTKAFRTPCE